MKKLIIFFLLLSFCSSYGQTKKDGTPDMRYKANKEMYGNSSLYTNSFDDTNFNTDIYNYSSTNSDVTYQNSYIKSDGTMVKGHYKTKSNNTNWDNFSTESNLNPYNQEIGTKAKDYSIDANNYGEGRIIQTGPRGGQYYINSNGNKTYVPKRTNSW